MKIRHLTVAAAALLLPIGVAACGSDDTNSGSRPSAEDLAKVFKEELPASTPGIDDIAQCIGEGLEASELPNGVLRSIAAGEDEQKIDPDNEEKYTKIIQDVSTDCASQAVDSLTGG